LLNIVAVIIGILHTVRKLDITRRKHEDFPHVREEDFRSWREQERLAYTVGSWACFLKVVLGSAFMWYASKGGLAWGWVRVIGGAIDVGWLAAIVWAMVVASRARKRRDELGIALNQPTR
jgi:hypothetical protein